MKKNKNVCSIKILYKYMKYFFEIHNYFLFILCIYLEKIIMKKRITKL